MEKVIVNNRASLQQQRGASIMEVLLSIAIVALMAPFLYNQINVASGEIRDIATAKNIMTLREPALNFVRLHQDSWPDSAQIKLSDEELDEISDAADSGFIDKYTVKGATITDIYLTFSIDGNALRAANIAKNIGVDAAIVGDDSIAYGASWAATAPDFTPGDLVYRISYDFNGDDNSKYLHRGTSGEDDFNVMLRTLHMGGFDMYNIGTVTSDSAKITDAVAAFADASDVTASSVYFANGANADGSYVKLGAMRVGGDTTGFRNITTQKINGSGYSTTGNVISDRATINKAVNVGRKMTLKSEYSRTVSGFVGISAHSLTVPYVSATEMDFFNDFGLTVSGELLMSTTAPIKFGNWTFPSMTPPKFSDFRLSRGTAPAAPTANAYNKIIQKGWRDAQPIR